MGRGEKEEEIREMGDGKWEKEKGDKGDGVRGKEFIPSTVFQILPLDNIFIQKRVTSLTLN